MLTDEQLIAIELKYFEILNSLLDRSLGQIITQINSQSQILGAATGGVANVIERAVENIVEAVIADQLHWNICSMPVSADSCFECGDAIVHIDAKTIAESDNDNTNNKVNVEKSQTNYVKGNPIFVGALTWEPKLNQYENHLMFGEIPNLTYIIKVVYSSSNCVEKIKLISLPNGQLSPIFLGANILSPGRSSGSHGIRGNIRFLEDKIAEIQPWRVETIYERR